MKKLVMYFSLMVLLGGIVSAFDPVSLYETNTSLIDFFVSFLIFFGLAKFTFGERFGDSSNFIIAGISLGLSLGLVMWTRETAGGLLYFGPVAVLILAAACGWILFTVFQGLGGFRAFLMSYITIYIFAFFIFEDLVRQYVPYGWSEYFFGIFVFAIVLVIIITFFGRRRV